MISNRSLFLSLLLGIFTLPSFSQLPKNVIFILSDDHRYDFMGFTGKVPGLETPNLDRLALEGAHFRNAFVTTALCSPSRASILTGQYAHTHTIVDNQSPAPEGLIFFPQYLQKAGYETAFFGKWHMGNDDGSPQPGFDHWVGFKGQGVYYNPMLNIDGEPTKFQDSTYITDLLTTLCIDWMKKQEADKKPFFVYLSHKAVHSGFQPAKRHKGRYQNLEFQYPPSMFITATDTSRTYDTTRWSGLGNYPVNERDIPLWVRQQRYSWHGVDYMYHGSTDLDEMAVDYAETLQGVDESIASVLDYLEKSGLAKETLVIYMGDNGFSFGEHGLIDKRHAYDESMRVPLLAWSPGFIKPNSKIDEMVLNIDIAPSILNLAGLQKPKQMQGESWLPILSGKNIPWRERVFYEYYWENAFPQTPTQFAVRTSQYKFIRSQGVWDINQLYNLETDPYEVNNLIRDPKYQSIASELNSALWDWLENTEGTFIPLKRIKAKHKDHKFNGTW